MANDVRYQTLMIMTKFSFLQGFGTASTGVINKRKSNCNTMKEAIFTLQRMWGISAPLKERGRLSFKYSLALGIRKVHLKTWSCCQASRFPLLITQTSKRASAIQILDWKYWCEFRWGDKSINPMVFQGNLMDMPCCLAHSYPSEVAHTTSQTGERQKKRIWNQNRL